jgi:hypothetical protein
MSWEGSAFFIKMSKYKPAGPPPMLTILIEGDLPQSAARGTAPPVGQDEDGRFG